MKRMKTREQELLGGVKQSDAKGNKMERQNKELKGDNEALNAVI